jgi:WD40 repeat protein
VPPSLTAASPASFGSTFTAAQLSSPSSAASASGTAVPRLGINCAVFLPHSSASVAAVTEFEWSSHRLLATGGADGVTRIWAYESDAQLLALESRHTFRADNGGVTAIAVCEADASVILVGYAEGAARLWDVPTAACRLLEVRFWHLAATHEKPQCLPLLTYNIVPCCLIWTRLAFWLVLAILAFGFATP